MPPMPYRSLLTPTTLVAAALAGSLGLAACGDDGGSTPDAPPTPATPKPRALAVSGTFTPGEAGVLSALTLESLEVAERVAPNGAIGSDPVLRRVGDELFVVNRADGNNVTILDANTYALVEQLSTGTGSNPQDVAVVGEKLFVPAFDTAGVVVITRGTGARETIDLSALDPDGEPNCVSAYAVDDRVYVACELLDEQFQPRGPGQIAVIDPATSAVATTFALANANPFGLLERAPGALLGGDLVIATVPSFADFSAGCVERIQTGAAPKANGCVVTNAALGGYVSRIAFQEDPYLPLLWMVASSFDTEAHGALRGYDLDADELWRDPVTPASQLIVDVAVCGDRSVVVADQTLAANGLRVYRDLMERTQAPLPIGLRPGSSHGLVCSE